MTESCPISPEVVDEHATRIGAGLTILVVLAAIWLGRYWIPLALAVDFFLRSRGWSDLSPIAQVAKTVRKAVGLKPRPTNAGPKRFAALIGVIFSLGISAALRFHHPRLALVLAAILIVCAALEAFLGFCLGCKVYGFIQPFLRNKRGDHDAE